MTRPHQPDYGSPARSPRPLEHLERIQPPYFFTPDLEREINKLDGVTSCRVISTGAEIEEIHVISPPDRLPKKIVRNIESLLLVRFGIRIDHRKVSVVQMGQETPPPPAPTRPSIVEIGMREGATGPEVHVQVRSGTRTVDGLGCAALGESELHASSRALLNAIEKLLNTRGALSLQDVSVVRAAGQDVVLALVCWTLDGQSEALIGASAVRGPLIESAARATFDALNRKLVRGSPARPPGA